MAARLPAGIEPGHEPPLDAYDGSATEVDRRDVNLRWLGASVLTGITGALLIGGAIYVSFDGETTFATAPQLMAVAPPKSGATEERTSNAVRKADKLVRSEVIASSKQTFRAPVTIRTGDREIIKVRPFVRVATNLSLTSGVYATDIPPFNPMRFFAEDTGERAPADPGPAEVADADVFFIKKDLTATTVEPGARELSDEEVLAQVEEERRLSAQAGRVSAVPIPAQMMLSRIVRQPVAEAFSFAPTPDTSFSSIEVLVVPENVTTRPKVEVRASDSAFEERDAILKKGETIETVLRANGASAEALRSMLNALSNRAKTGLPEGQRIRLLIGVNPRTGQRGIVRIVLFGERGIEEIVASNDRGTFVSVALPADETQKREARTAEEEEEGEEEAGGVRLYDSLYETAMKNDLTRQTVEDLIRIFGYDVDFQRRVSAGDSLELFYGLDEEGGGTPEILYAALTTNGETRRVFRYQSPEDGGVEYLDELGRSLKKFLLRKPIAEGQLRSGFGMRRHPILGYAKMHTGVDWANRIGTPIFSAGNGTVVKAEWDSGYGRRVEVQHANGYLTAYSHMSKFGRGIQSGARVRQGQVIGYVGSTGLSTGPHLHYEVVVNGRFVDPMRIRVPRGRELDGRALAEFKRQREQVEALLQKADGAGRITAQAGSL